MHRVQSEKAPETTCEAYGMLELSLLFFTMSFEPRIFNILGNALSGATSFIL